MYVRRFERSLSHPVRRSLSHVPKNLPTKQKKKKLRAGKDSSYVGSCRNHKVKVIWSVLADFQKFIVDWKTTSLPSNDPFSTEKVGSYRIEKINILFSIKRKVDIFCSQDGWFQLGFEEYRHIHFLA